MPSTAISPLIYDDPTLDALLPDLEGRRRLDLIEQDLAELGVETLAVDTALAFARGAAVDLPTALGWLPNPTAASCLRSDLRYAFVLEGGKIARLEITL